MTGDLFTPWPSRGLGTRAVGEQSGLRTRCVSWGEGLTSQGGPWDSQGRQGARGLAWGSRGIKGRILAGELLASQGQCHAQEQG